MKLVVVGCAGSFPSPESAASSYLLQAEGIDPHSGQLREWNLLLDLGNGALGPLQTHIDPCRLDAIAISHTHADHIADVVVLGVMLRYAPTGCPRSDLLPMYGPPGLSERLSQLSGHDPATDTGAHLTIGVWQDGEPVTIGPFTIEPVPVKHPVPAFGLRITGPSSVRPGESATLSYTGDTDECAGLDRLAADTDLLLCEAAYLESGPPTPRGIHLTGARAGRAAARGRSRALVLTHLVAWNDPAATAAEAAAEYDGPVQIARPRLTIEL